MIIWVDIKWWLLYCYVSYKEYKVNILYCGVFNEFIGVFNGSCGVVYVFF